MTTPRPAASLILIATGADGQRCVLMGRRTMRAKFMPGVWVPPGGGVEDGDSEVPCALPADAWLSDLAWPPAKFAGAALAETQEETGLSFDPAPLMRCIGRAITPPGLPRRYDTLFFAAELTGPPPSPGAGDGELDDVQWVAEDRLDGLDMMFVTRGALEAALEGECAAFYTETPLAPPPSVAKRFGID